MDATRLDRLSSLRAAQEEALSSSIPVRDFASISREYRATLAEIAELEPKEKAGDGIDEIAARRSARRAGTSKPAGRSKLAK